MNRSRPVGQPRDYRTFEIRSPISTHTRSATCEEVGCGHWRDGWRTPLDKATQAALIKTVYESGRKPVAILDEGDTVTFVFEPGTVCFAAATHRVPADRPAIYIRRDGDWRRSTNPRRYDRADQWVDDFAANQDRLATLVNRG